MFEGKGRARVLLVAFALLGAPATATAGEPYINPEFPIKDGEQLSPPQVGAPIHECAAVVLVKHFVPHATVRVYAGGVELVGEATPDVGWATVPLKRPLELGESITATQTVSGMTSLHSLVPVVVSPFASGLGKPRVHEALWACGRVVPVLDLTESTRVLVLADGAEIGRAENAGTKVPILTKPLVAGQKVTAVQVACMDGPGEPVKSEESDPVVVGKAPSPPGPPTMSTPVVGNDVVSLHGLFVGAGVTVEDAGAWDGGGFATAPNNLVPLEKPIGPASSLTATQELCEPSKPSEPEPPVSTLAAPVVVGPICDGSQFVTLRDTKVNANVLVRRNGALAAYGGAVNGELVMSLSVPVKKGDAVTARQYMGTTVSPVSNAVIVSGTLSIPDVQLSGAEPFFQAGTAAQPIDGPVFPRGRGPGPRLRVTTCCDQKVAVEILGVKGEVVASVPMVQEYPGTYTGTWDWSSKAGWKIPAGIPVGAYTVRVKSGCDQKLAMKRFYVIFDPAEVTAPARFAFNRTGIWFVSDAGHDHALSYALHPDDLRIFGQAMTLVAGETSAHAASKLLQAWVEPAFGTFDCGSGPTGPLPPGKRWRYSICTSENDVLDLLARPDQAAQCADSANLLVAMMRAAGIPSHPVTADGDLEHGGIGWRFDTWVEARLDGPSGERWYATHPHEHHPLTERAGAGQWGVATKQADDLIIMANESWVAADVNGSAPVVSFGWNTPCGEPDQGLVKKSWVDHLCGDYWGVEHWTCPAPAPAPPVHVAIARGPHQPGDPLRLEVSLRNDGLAAARGTLTVALGIDRLVTPLFPDLELPIAKLDVELAAGETRSETLEARVPAELSTEHRLSVLARFGDGSSVVPVPVAPPFTAELTLPEGVEAGRPFQALLSVRNTGPLPLEGLRVRVRATPRDGAVRLTAPGLATTPVEGGVELPELSLRGGETRELPWTLVGKTPSDAASVRVEIVSRGRGTLVVTRGLELRPAPVDLPRVLDER